MDYITDQGKFNHSYIMKLAHQNARFYLETDGGSYKQLFNKELKTAYGTARLIFAKCSIIDGKLHYRMEIDTRGD